MLLNLAMGLQTHKRGGGGGVRTRLEKSARFVCTLEWAPSWWTCGQLTTTPHFPKAWCLSYLVVYWPEVSRTCFELKACDWWKSRAALFRSLFRMCIIQWVWFPYWCLDFSKKCVFFTLYVYPKNALFRNLDTMFKN